MTQYNHPVNVPIRVDALWSDAQPITAPLTTDFTRLKKTLPPTGGNFSNARPWLGDTVRPAANDAPPTLAKGLHLHWTLPQALRHGTSVYVLDYTVFNELVQQGVPCTLVQGLKEKATIGAELTLTELTDLLTGLAPTSFTPLSGDKLNPDQNAKHPTHYPDLISSTSGVDARSYTPALSWDPIFLELYAPLIVQAAARMKLPPVPNRWLVLRTGGGEATAWVVESDRLSPPNEADGTPPQGAGPAAVPGQFDSTFVKNAQSVTLANAFQYLGLTSPAGRWHEPGGSATVLSPLTAAGSGLVDFAAFYPNCQGVFGFCDPSAVKSTTYIYTIIGWFSDKTNDPAAPGYNVAPWASMSLADRFADLGWQVPGYPDSIDSSIDGSVYSAKISVTGTSCAAQSLPSMTSVKVAVGNTAGEALAAYLAKDSKLTTASWGLTAETLLDAAQAGALRRVLEADGPAVVEQALHQQAFQAQSGGSRWEIVPVPPSPSQPGLSPKLTPLPPLTVDVEKALSALNTAQLQFDRTQAYLTAQRRLLFTDWCRASHLQTDASGATDADPNALTVNSSNGQIQIGTLAADLVNQSALAVDAAGMADDKPKSMLGLLAAKALYLAHAAALGALASMTESYTLKRRAAPRFYRPNDPAVLLCDEESGSSPLTTTPADSLPTVTEPGGDDETWLVCSVVIAGTSRADGLPDPWPDGPSANCVATVQSSLAAVQGAQSWRPISLTWQAQCFPYPKAGKIDETAKGSGKFSVTDYAPTFITDNFKIDDAGIDLVATSSADTSTVPIYNGRVVLSDHANTTLRARILQLAGEDTTSPPKTLDTSKLPGALAHGDVATLLSNAYANNYVTLAQALDGFNDRLLMLRRIPQTALFDCGYESAEWNSKGDTASIWDPDSQSFYLEVGRQNEASPQQGDVYSPIRANRCELTNLWLVDAFGQIREWSLDTKNLTIASTLPDLTAKDVQNAAPAFLLPPRLAQPSRLLFRWVAADGSGMESVDLASTSPICGWVMLNRVDETLMFFAKDGTLLGWVPTQGGAMQSWPPNSSPSIDPLLNQVIEQAKGPGSTMYDDIATALLTIEPRAHRQHRASSVLFSRPLALACATLQLEVLGGPAPHQGYEWLATAPLDKNQDAKTDSYCPVQQAAGDDLKPKSPFPQRETCAFDAVTFPVRLGDVSMDDDGLVAYWTVDNNNIAPSYCLVDPTKTGEEEPTLGMTVDPTASPTGVLLLLDPRAPVHAVSGILPTKVIDIPPEMFTGAVKNMELLLTVGPVLSPAEADPPLLPLPAEIRGGWRWTEGTATSAAMTGQIDDRAHLSPDPPVLREGWLSLPGAGGQ